MNNFLSEAITPDNQHSCLISFYTLIDLDIGLINFIKKRYLDPKVFKKEFFNRPLLEIINDSYHRTEENVMELFIQDNIPKEDMLAYYEQFMTRHEKEIINEAVTTEMKNLALLFQSDGTELDCTIIYYSKAQLETLDEDEELKDIKKIYYKDLQNKNTLAKYSDIYLHRVSELDYYYKYISNPLNIYFSTFRNNMAYDENFFVLKQTDAIAAITKQRKIDINTFVIDLYNEKLLRKE